MTGKPGAAGCSAFSITLVSARPTSIRSISSSGKSAPLRIRSGRSTLSSVPTTADTTDEPVDEILLLERLNTSLDRMAADPRRVVRHLSPSVPPRT